MDDVEAELQAAVPAPPRGRARRVVVVATSLLGLAVPVVASHVVHGRIDGALSDALTSATGQACRIGDVDAGLTGTVRLHDVRIGDLVSADAVEAAVALPNLLRGELSADQITVERPVVHAHLTADGELDLVHVLRRALARHQASATAGASPRRLRRIIVTGGVLRADIIGIGSVSLADVEFVPSADGVRVVSGQLELHAEQRGVAIAATFDRLAADVDLRTSRVTRLLAVRGRGGLQRIGAAESLELAGLSVSRGVEAADRAIWVRGDAVANGVPRPLVLTVAPGPVPTAQLTTEGLPLAVVAGLLPRALDGGDAMFAGRLGLASRGGELAIDAAGTLQALRFLDRDVAAEAVPLDLVGSLRATARPGHLALDAADVQLQQAHLTVAGSIDADRSGLHAANLTFDLAPTSCLALLESIPAPMRAALDGLTLDGELGGRATFDVDLTRPTGAGVVFEMALPLAQCKVVADAPGADPAVLSQTRTQRMPDGSTRLLGADAPGWTPLLGLPAHVAGAFVAAEDDAFWSHDGFDLNQIASSLEIDLRQRRLLRGGSTISQQLVKNLFLNQRRSLDRKLQEAIVTWRVEATASKATILENYLNVVELGPGIYGLTDACAFWFGREPRRLTPRQAAFLAALTPEPRSWHRRLVANHGIDPQSRARIEQVLRQMRRSGAIDTATFDVAMAAPLTLQPGALVARQAR